MSERPVAVVTGGKSGVGAASAEWFAARGFDILLSYRSGPDAAEAVAARCRSAGAAVELVRGDVGRDEDCRAAAARAAERWDRADVLVNSAGTTLFRPMGDLDQLDAQDFHDIYAVNLIGPYQMVRAFAPLLRRARGNVVNISSVAGHNGTGSSYAYAASKAALNNLTVALARNLAPDIRVNAVLPGLIDSEWIRKGLGDEAHAKVRAQFLAQAALARVSTPADIAETVGWLATAAPTVTGQLIMVDGGVTLGHPPVVGK